MAHKINSKPLCMMNKALHDLNSELFPLHSGSLFSFLGVHHSLCHHLIQVGFPWKQSLRHIELECRSLIRPWSWDHQDKKGKKQKGAEREVGLWQVICWSQLAWKSADAVNQGFPSSPREPAYQLTSGCSAIANKASAEPTKCLKAGKALQGCPKLEVRELGIYTPLLSVTGCGLSLEGGMTLGKLSSAEAVPKEGWRLKAVCRYLPGSWGSQSFKRSLPHVPYSLRICSSLSTTGSARWGTTWQSAAHV